MTSKNYTETRANSCTQFHSKIGLDVCPKIHADRNKNRNDTEIQRYDTEQKCQQLLIKTKTEMFKQK